MSNTYGAIHIRATAAVAHHCGHSTGRSSYLLGGPGGVVVYVTGTPEEIQVLGARLILAATEQAAKRIEAQS